MAKPRLRDPDPVTALEIELDDLHILAEWLNELDPQLHSARMRYLAERLPDHVATAQAAVPRIVGLLAAAKITAH